MFSYRNISHTLTAVGLLACGGSLLAACDDREISQQAATQQQAAQQLDSANSTSTVPLGAGGKATSAPTSTKAVEKLPPGPLPHYNVHFSVGSAQLSPDAMETLTSAAGYLRTYPAVQIKLSGYTDLLGSAATNKKLAEQRVASAAQYLEKSGIDRIRIVTDAVGEADPSLVPSGENPTTWNRRVEVEFSISPSS
jgi:outer membrane protein OmpA-like peptidoglycan-associated protein